MLNNNVVETAVLYELQNSSNFIENERNLNLKEGF